MYIEAKWLTNNLNRKCIETHLRVSTFSKIFRDYTLDPLLQRVEGLREGDSWERKVREERGGEENVQSKQNLRMQQLENARQKIRKDQETEYLYLHNIRETKPPAIAAKLSSS
jgi:hypothetical protein